MHKYVAKSYIDCRCGGHQWSVFLFPVFLYWLRGARGAGRPPSYLREFQFPPQKKGLTMGGVGWQLESPWESPFGTKIQTRDSSWFLMDPTSLLEPTWGILEPAWNHLGPSGAYRGATWESLGGSIWDQNQDEWLILIFDGSHLSLGANLGHIGACLEPSWDPLELTEGQLGSPYEYVYMLYKCYAPTCRLLHMHMLSICVCTCQMACWLKCLQK